MLTQLKQFLKVVGYTVILLLMTLLLYILSFVAKSRFEKTYHRLFRLWSAIFAKALGVDLRLQDHTTSAMPEHFIMIANHPSAFEDIGLPALFDVVSLAKIEVADWWIVGRISSASGTLYVNRESKTSRAQAQADIISEVRKGKNVALYPEGGCKGKLIADKFYFGAFEASIQTRVPVVPVFIHYHAQDDFYWGPGVPLVSKIWQILNASDHTADYHLFDPFFPENYPDKQAYSDAARQQYLKWQEQYLLPTNPD